MGRNQPDSGTRNKRRKVMNTLDKFGIELYEIEKWKNNNWSKIEQILQNCSHKEYSVMKKNSGCNKKGTKRDRR